MNSSVLLRVVASSVSIANKAGLVIRDILRTGELGIVDKAQANPKNYDPQTEADRAAQKIIVGSLTKQFGGLKIIGEEDDCDKVDDDAMLVTALEDSVLSQTCPSNLAGISIEDLVVWVDPLDGTKEFTEGNLDHVTVLIGVSAHGKAVAGVIHQPFFGYNTSVSTESEGRTLWGVVGLGLHGMKVIDPITGRRIVTTTKSHSNKLVLEAVDAMNADSVIRTGGAGYKAMLLAEGIADAYVFASRGCKKWDTCASEAVLKSIGGEFTDIHGSTIDYSITDNHVVTQGVLATRIDHAYYLSRVPMSVRNAMLGK